MKKNLEWYRSHDSLTKIKLKNQINKDVAHFIDSDIALISIHLEALAHFYDVSGSSFGDSIISELARLVSCFFDENYIYRDGYNGFIVITDYPDYSMRLMRLKENCAQYKIQDYLVFATLEYSAARGYVSQAKDLDDLLDEAKHLGRKSDSILEEEIHSEDHDLDDETGLLNMDAFRHKADKILTNHDLLKEKFVFIHLDIRNFHLFNQRFGHEASLKMIQLVGSLLSDQFAHSLTCHITMDRFAIFANEQGIEERLTRLFQSFDFHYDLEFVYLIAGIYRVNEIVPASTGIERSRLACISLKDKTEKRFCYFDEEIRKELLKEKMVIENLDQAIRKGDLEIYYQPIFRTMTGETASYEAVSRWHHGLDDILMPEEYVPILEHHHMIHILDTWMIEQVCKDLARRRYNKETILPCGINLSLHDFELCNLIDILNKQTALYQLPRNMLFIEIRNFQKKDGDAFISEQLQRLHYLGYRIFMDNFGEEMSPLQLMDSTGIDGFKINMAHLSAFNEPSQLMIRALVRAAREMGLLTTIMGIETKEQADFAKNIMCSYMQGRYLGDVLPYEQMQKQESNKHMIIETAAERNYQDALSKVDLGKMPLSEDPQVDVAVAIVEVTHHVKHIVVANESFRQMVRQIGFKDINALDQLSNMKPAIFIDHMNSVVAKAKSSDNLEPFEVVINNYQIKLNLKYLKATGDKVAYMISVDELEPISQNNAFASPVLDYFYRRFDVIYLLSPLSQHAECLYFSDTFDMPKDLSVLEVVKQAVYPGDEKKLSNLLDPQQALSRIYSSSYHCVTEEISLRDSTGNYSLRQFVLSLASDGDDPLILLTIASQDEADSPKKADESTFYDAGMLWDNMVSQLHIGIFWKDMKRRFVGANDAFMKYYGFNSVDEFKGKTDEDIGWHVSPDAFALDEEEVLSKGVMKINRHGTCIVDGMIHPIIACKMPVYNHGKISGLVGFFKDMWEDSQPVSQPIAYLDDITGSANVLGINICIERYINEYKDKHRDFVLMAISLDNMQEMTDENGLDYTHHALKKIADVLHAQMGSDCVIGHILGDIFVMVHQNDDEILTRRILSNAIHALKNITTVDGLPFTPYFSQAYQYYSAVDEHYDIVNLTLKRLVLMRDAHKIATNESYKKHSINLYKTISREYEPVFGHIVLMDEQQHILYAQHMNKEVHDFLTQGNDSLVATALQTQNTYSDIEEINNQTYYCVVKYQSLEGMTIIIEAAKRVDL